jgi:hypothetical protein
MSTEEETAVVKQGLGMGGLGNFTAEDLVGSLVPATESPKGTATGEGIRDAMGGRSPQLERIKVKHGGACIIQMPDDERVEELLGVVVAYTYHNSWFSTKFEDHESGERPDCYSNDATNIAEQVEDAQAPGGCRSCPRNRDARDQGARDKAYDGAKESKTYACSNYLSLAIALPGVEVPVHLRLSQSSFRTWAEYVQHIGTRGRFQPHEVATRFTLKNKTGPGGSEFSVVQFEMIDALPAELRAEFTKQQPNYEALLKRSAVDTEREDVSAEAAEALAQAKKDEAAAAEEKAAL